MEVERELEKILQLRQRGVQLPTAVLTGHYRLTAARMSVMHSSTVQSDRKSSTPDATPTAAATAAAREITPRRFEILDGLPKAELQRGQLKPCSADVAGSRTGRWHTGHDERTTCISTVDLNGDELDKIAIARTALPLGKT